MDGEKLDALLSYVEEGEVIPIIGQQLLSVCENGAVVTVSQLLAHASPPPGTFTSEFRLE